MGRYLTLPMQVATLVATWYGGLFGVTAIAFEQGLYNFIIQGVFWYITYIIFALWPVEKIRSKPTATLAELVDSCLHSTNRPYLTDIISFLAHPTYRLNPAILVKSYQEEGLSSGQVAKKLGISKSTVIKKLQGFGVSLRSKRGRMTIQNNYRHHNPPYGYSVKKGVLAPNPREVKVCRLIVNLIRDKGMGYSEVGRALGKKQIKNRKDKVKWGHSVIKGIFDRHKNNF